jgi:hypothetical protein
MKWMAIAAALLLGWAGAAHAQASDAAGRWAVRSNGRPLMIVTLSHDGAGWHGTWRRPARFTSDATFGVVTNVEGPAVDRPLIAATERGDGIELRFAGRPGEAAQEFRFTVSPAGIARMTSTAAAGAILVLDRARPGETVIAYDPHAEYPIDQHRATSPVMTAIFEADQKAREDWAHADASAVATQDAARREQVKKLLAAGALQSGEDFYHAAFVFQHGMEPNDYLLAHALAVIAAERGKQGAAWIAAATLDRYLQAIGKPQIYGTQYTFKQKVTDGEASGPRGVSQEPYDRTLLSDALRIATGVPPLADQKAQGAAL